MGRPGGTGKKAKTQARKQGRAAAPRRGGKAEAKVLSAAAAAPGPRLTLPSSGLASDILALAAVTPLAALAERSPTPAAPGPEPAAARSHNISFFGSQTREERKTVEATEHLATFYLAGEEYGVDVRLVQEIIRLAEITQVPRAPQFVKGVINLRGRIIPVIDLKRKLGLGEVEPGKQARIVVVRVRERLLGLLVDGASQVLKVPVSVIEAAPEEVVEIDASYIRGVAKLEKRLIILVDLQKVLSAELRDGPGLAPA
ncbi:MAG TPA: chemotaxis protein CheW [Vicinamibacteria bacterium]|nr:chemotaxis protein CheW [Vicinamibacteria bacterium]